MKRLLTVTVACCALAPPAAPALAQRNLGPTCHATIVRLTAFEEVQR